MAFPYPIQLRANHRLLSENAALGVLLARSGRVAAVPTSRTPHSVDSRLVALLGKNCRYRHFF